MKLKQLIILILFVFLNQTIFSQTIIKGTVKDDKNSIIIANVIAFDTVLNKIETYATANNSGYYELSLPKNKHFELRISYLGYKTAIIPIFTGEKDIIEKNIRLIRQEYKLENVEITYTQPIKVNGDTVTYDANSFSKGNERKLGDILENLPGVELTNKGEIKVKGKTVSKIMVDNKDFFSGDTKLATQNIPANVIDKIQVLNNYSEVGMMKGVNAGDNNPVINIKLKEGKKHFWFGDIEAGAGFENKYLFNPKLFYYSPKTSVNFIGNISNTGKQSFNFQDYIRLSGGISNLLEGSNGTFSMNSDELGFLFMPNNKAKKINPKFGALNINHNFSKKLSVSGFAILNIDDILMQEQSNKEYFANVNSENVNSVSNINSLFSLYNFRLNYQPSYKVYIDYNLYGKYNNSNFNNDINSSISGNTDTKKSSNISDFKQNFKLYYSAGEKGILSLNLKHKYFDNSLNTNFYSENNNFNFPEFIKTDGLHFAQIKEVSGNEFSVIAEYIYLINKQNNIRINFGSDFTNNKLLLNTEQLTSEGNIVFPDNSDFSNMLSKELQYYYSSLKYKTLKGKLTVSGGIKFHHFISANKQKTNNYSDVQTIITPDIFLKYSFMKTKDMILSYSASPQFIGISSLSEAYTFSGYNNLKYGNGNLKSSLYHNFSLNYMFFNNFSFSNTRWFLNYSRKINPEGISSELKNNIYISKYEQLSKPKQTASSNFNYEKRISKFKVSFNNLLNYSTYENIINNELASNELFSHNYKLSVSTFFKDAPNFEAGTNQAFTNFSQNKIESDYLSSDFFANIEIPFLNQFIFTADYNYKINKNLHSSNKNYYSFLNADLYYKTKNKAWEFSISGKNLLNTKTLKEISNNDLFAYSSDYYIQGISVMLLVVYKL